MTLLSVFFLSVTVFCFSDEKPEHLDYWQGIIEGDDSLKKPEEQGWNLSEKVKTFNEFEGKQILAFVRQGDYTHAGEEEAIELIMSFFPKDSNRKILDVACGLGGTADYIQKKGWGTVTGFDIDQETIKYAKMTYPNCQFFLADVLKVSDEIETPNFDLICIVNSFVCFHDQLQCLKELKKLAKPTTKLVIFDYTDLIENGENPLTGKSKNVSFFPIKQQKIETWCEQSGWEINEYVNLDKTFILWYEQFLDRIESKRKDIDEHFGKNATNYLRGKYDLIYYALKNKWMGGSLIILSSAEYTGD